MIIKKQYLFTFANVILLFLSSIRIISAQAPENASTIKAKISQFDAEIKEKNKSVDSIRVELEKGRQKLKELQEQEGSHTQRIEQLEKNLKSARSYLSQLQDLIKENEKNLTYLTDSLKSAEKKLQDRQQQMKQRIRQAYLTGKPNPVINLLTASNPLEAINRIRYIQELALYDRQLAMKIDSSRNEISKRKSDCENQHKTLESLLHHRKAEEDTLVKEESLHQNMLKEVRDKKKNYLAMIQELEIARKEMTAIIKKLEERRRKAAKVVPPGKLAAFEKRKGKLPWPVKGQVVSPFGKVVHPVYKTVTMNSGIDIAVSKAQDVITVASGTVIHIGAMRGLGRFVIIEHVGGYITIYARLQEISVRADEVIESGEIIGHVSSKGDLNNPAALHFEIRKSTVSLNPMEWLE